MGFQDAIEDQPDEENYHVNPVNPVKKIAELLSLFLLIYVMNYELVKKKRSYTKKILSNYDHCYLGSTA